MLLCFKHAVLPEIISLWNNQEHKETVAMEPSGKSRYFWAIFLTCKLFTYIQAVEAKF